MTAARYRAAGATGQAASKRKLRAVRIGIPAGTGPTSAAGKARVARNPRKHGLNVPVMYDPDTCAVVEAMAAEIIPNCKDGELLGRARRIAEAQVDLMRVARVRLDVLATAMAAPGHGAAAPTAVECVAILADASARLARLDRYERAALGRRMRAIRAYDLAYREGARRRRKRKQKA